MSRDRLFWATLLAVGVLSALGIYFLDDEPPLERPSSFAILFPKKGPSHFLWNGIGFSAQEPGRVKLEGEEFCFLGVSGEQQKLLAHQLIEFQRAVSSDVGIGVMYGDVQVQVVVFGQSALLSPRGKAAQAARPLLQIPFATTRERNWRICRRDPYVWILVGLK